jgi:hypothetical protein
MRGIEEASLLVVEPVEGGLGVVLGDGGRGGPAGDMYDAEAEEEAPACLPAAAVFIN